MRCSLFLAITLGLLTACSQQSTETPAPEGATPEAAAQSATPAPSAAATVPPAEVAKQFFEASNAGDEEAVLNLMTAKARESIGSDDSMSMSEQNFESFSIGEATIEGGEARVPVDATQDGMEQSVTMMMRSEENQWRIYGVEVSFAEGMAMTVNFEELSDMMEQMAAEMGEALGAGLEEAFSGFSSGGPEEIALKKVIFESLEGVSAEAYEAMWKNTADFKGQPKIDALNALADGIGLSIHLGESAGAFEGNVESDLTGIPRAEAIERICATAGVYPVFPDPRPAWGFLEAMAEGMMSVLESALSPETLEAVQNPPEDEVPLNAITFMPGTRDLPIQFGGPFIFSIEDLSTNAPNPTGSITFAVRAYGLAPGILDILQQDYEATRIAKVTGPNGNSLIDTDMSFLSGGQSAGRIYADAFGLSLSNLLSSVTHIAEFSGEQTLYLPETIVETELASLEEGQTAEAGEFKIEVDSSDGSYTQLKITGPEEKMEGLEARFWVTSADGTDLDISSASTDSWEAGVANATVQTYEDHAALRIKLLTMSGPHTYPFALNEIPVPGYDQMPDKIEELSFEGDQGPITATFDRFLDDEEQFRSVAIKVTNHSNKDAESVYTNFVYLDANGEELDDFPSTLTGDFGPSGIEPVAKAGATIEHEATAFGMPEGVASIRVVVQSVEFTDGTSWQAESDF